MTVNVAIQCTDRRTKQIGTFGYRTGRELYSVTPVFPSMVELVNYCNKHNIVVELVNYCNKHNIVRDYTVD